MRTGATLVDMTAVNDLLSDSFARVAQLVSSVTDGLSPEAAAFRPDPEANTIGWLIWHLSRVQDDHISGVAGTEQVWPKWRAQFDLPFDETAIGYGQTSAEVAQVRVDPRLLGEYHSEVAAATAQYVESLTDEDLARVVDENWDPPVTLSARLVSVIGDCLQHLGQAAYLKGLTERAGVA